MHTNIEHKIKFEQAYIQYYSRLKRFAYEYIMCEEDVENILQDLFLDLWERGTLMNPHANLLALLLTMLRNRCIDFLRRKTTQEKIYKKIEDESILELKMKYESLKAIDDNFFLENDVESIVQNAINSLPDKCREIFILSKIEGKKQKTIAKDLNISIYTVENQMAIAYKKLKELLKHYIPLFFYLVMKI